VSRGRLVVFARQPLAGAVKTRLTPPFSPGEAAEFYGCMLDDVLETSGAVAREYDLEPIVAVHPGRAALELVQRAPAGFRAVAQRGLDLSERMAWALGEAAAADAWPLVLRGSDSPMLAPDRVGEVMRTLRERDVAILPDRDGGYSMIGFRRFAPGVFEHPMSTGTVAEDTRSQVSKLGLSAHTLAPSFDVDHVEDLRLLAEARTGPAAGLCPRSLGFLDENDLWRHLGTTAREGISG
jgi:rSAM/selenodomain-associated transferase 1